MIFLYYLIVCQRRMSDVEKETYRTDLQRYQCKDGIGFVCYIIFELKSLKGYLDVIAIFN